MTEEEWRKEQGDKKVKDFDLRHARAYLNSIMDETYTAYDFSDPLAKIEAKKHTFITEKEKHDYLEEFSTCLAEHFQSIFVDAQDEDYTALLYVCCDLLQPYAMSDDFVDDILSEIKTEIEFYNEMVKN